MSSTEAWVRTAALRPGRSLAASLPTLWTVAPGDDGGWWLLGGHLAGDPDVLVGVEQAVVPDRGDVGESVAWLLAELLAVLTSGRTEGVDIPAEQRAQLESRLRMLLRTGREHG